MSTPLGIPLVDDSPFFLSFERQQLGNPPATLLEAPGAGEAVALARRYRPSLVFMAIDMPGTDGLTCCRLLREDQELRGSYQARPAAKSPEVALSERHRHQVPWPAAIQR